ncbi:MAG: hypothetical protein A2298_00910 [Gammaproteobacteria bacterium RIFOXYB2_FULL_38_6]|nr:MAG: hypothetical protein A2298_00910 [Gammaproteobacteria bacterium RIFOXYB2_FULL_38_6]
MLGSIPILLAVFKFFFWPKIKGWLGEAGINFLIRKLLNNGSYQLVPDIMLPTLDGITQIDHIIVSRYGIFVLETKTYKGWIYGDENEPQWTQVIFRRKERFQNPLRQNYKHIKTLSDLAGIPFEYFKSLVVFVGDNEFKTPMPKNVVHAVDFIRYIESQQKIIIRDEQVPEIVETIRAWSGTLSDEQKANHVHNLNRKKAPVPVNDGVPRCQKCGAVMALRTNRKDGNQFWGCSNFPKCKHTQPVA